MKKISDLKSQISNLTQAGFTLVELLVAMGIFVTALGIVVGIFIGSLRAERSLVGFMAINDNVSLALEQMAREIRNGEDFQVFEGGDLDILLFENAQGVKPAYGVASGAIYRGVCSASTCTSITDFNEIASITGNKAIVSRLSFTLLEGSASDPWPPRIIIQLGVESASPDTFGGRTDIQTTVSARGN